MHDILPGNHDLIPDRQVARELNVTTRTLREWELRPELDFPVAFWICGRKYRRRGDLEDFKQRHRARQHAAKRTSYPRDTEGKFAASNSS
jgi:hypothetical protein